MRSDHDGTGARDVLRLLLVEDDPSIQAVASIALEELGGFSVVTCGDGLMALAVLRAEPPDVVLLDVMLPGMDGLGVLAAMRQEPALKRVPVVLVTARLEAAEVARYEALDVAGVIAKPFDPLTLGTVVRRLLERAQCAS